MTKVKKTYRLDSDLVSELEKYAQSHNISQTEALERAIQSAVQSAVHENPQETAPDTDWKSLYLEEKQQNRELTEKLLELTGKVADSLQASQTLQAMDKPTLESVAQKEERVKQPWWKFWK